MHYRIIQTTTLTGTVDIPPSKSHTMRAILFASMAKGESVIRNYLSSPDTFAMIHACRALGADIVCEDDHEKKLVIRGCDGKPKVPDNVIDAGNSGQVLRFIAALAALTQNGYVIITGDESIRNNRPIQPLIAGLNQLGAFAVSTRENDTAPIIIKGAIHRKQAIIDGQDSQPVSALLMSCVFAKQPTEIIVNNPGETPWIDLTLSWLSRFHIPYHREGYHAYQLAGGAAIDGFEYDVPGDFSAAAFPLAAGFLLEANLCLQPLTLHDVQGDKAIIDVVKQLGFAKVVTSRKHECLEISADAQHIFQTQTKTQTQTTITKTIDANPIIDAVPILAVLACFAPTPVHITNAYIARRKESDRLNVISTELTKMGACIQLHDDGLTIKPSDLHGAIVDSHHDHRIAMALAIAGLRARGETMVRHVDCVRKSFPNFAQSLQQVGARIEVIT